MHTIPYKYKQPRGTACISKLLHSQTSCMGTYPGMRESTYLRYTQYQERVVTLSPAQWYTSVQLFLHGTYLSLDWLPFCALLVSHQCSVSRQWLLNSSISQRRCLLPTPILCTDSEENSTRTLFRSKVYSSILLIVTGIHTVSEWFWCTHVVHAAVRVLHACAIIGVCT